MNGSYIMKRLLVWLGFMALSAIILVGMSMAIPSIINADSSQSITAPSDFIKSYYQALTNPLNKAASEVKDPEIGQFSRKLINSYNLESISTTDPDKAELYNLVPDIAAIQKNALRTTLTEAGKTLKDKDLSEFYQRFLSNSGLDK